MSSTPDHQYWMQQALIRASYARDLNEVPVGCIIVSNNEIIGEGWNQCISAHDATAHAEIVAIRDAGKNIDNYRLTGSTMYVTIEPCTMCTGAIVHARIATLVFGATEPKAGAIVSAENFSSKSHFNHKLTVIPNVMAEECSEAISDFFKARRLQKKQLKTQP